jgi:hypothetical protein
LKQKWAFIKSTTQTHQQLLDSNMSTTLCIKYALGYVTVEDVTWIFNKLFGEELVIKVTELIKKDRYSGKDFKIFFIECDKVKQTKGKLDQLAAKIAKNKMAKVEIDNKGHFWQVCFARDQPKENDSKAEFTPRIMEEPEATLEELEKAMEGLQTDDEVAFLRGHKRGAEEEGEITEPKRANAGQVIEAHIAHDDPIYLEALRDTLNHFSDPNLFPKRS